MNKRNAFSPNIQDVFSGMFYCQVIVDGVTSISNGFLPTRADEPNTYYDSIPTVLLHLQNTSKTEKLFRGWHSYLSDIENLVDKSMKFGKGLVSMGLKPGDVVVLALTNSVEWVVGHFGILFAGCVSWGLTFSKKTGDDVKYSIEKSGKCRALIMEGTESQNLLNIAEKWMNNTDRQGKNRRIIEFVISVNKHAFPFTVADVLNAGSCYVELPDIAPDDDCIIFQTSGTSGNPKLGLWSHSRLLQTLQGAYRTFEMDDSDICFTPSYFSWVGGYLHGFLLTGCTHVTIKNFMAVGDAAKIAELIINILNKEKCTRAFLKAFCIYKMLEIQLNLPLTEPLKGVIVGGHPIRKSICLLIERFTQKLFIAYGSSEIMFATVKQETTSENMVDFNCGYPIPDTEIKLVDENNKIITRRKHGHIYVRPRSRFQGYLNDPEKTALVTSASGWYNTHDTGYLTENGELIVFGRKTDPISNVYGVWFAASPIETLLIQHKDVQEAVIIPVPDQQVYQKSCACIIRHKGSIASWEDICSVLRSSRTAKVGTMEMDVLIPDYHVFVDSFPRTTSGKLQKQELYEQIKYLIQAKTP